MSLANYDGLAKEFEDWMHRNDLGTKFDTFLNLAETEMNSNPEETLKILSLETIATASTVTTSRFLALPNGLNSDTKLTITLDDRFGRLGYVSPGNLEPDESCPGVPSQYTISNNQIEFNRLPDDVYTITILYSLADTPLSATNQTNVILTRYPNIYLFGCLAQGFAFVQDTEQEVKYQRFFLQAIKDANKRERMIKYPTGINIKVPRVV